MLIFAEKKADVDAIHEYLLLKGVEAVAIHGGKGVHNSILIIEIHNNRYAVIVPAEENCIWSTQPLLFDFRVVAHQYHQMPSCPQVSPCLHHSLLNISKAQKALQTLLFSYVFPFVIFLRNTLYVIFVDLSFRSGGKNKSHRSI